jgi:hypothetical protein
MHYAVAPIVKMVVVTREVLGELHEEVVGSLEMMARLHELRDDWFKRRRSAMGGSSGPVRSSHRC